MIEEGLGQSDRFHLNHAVELDAVIVTRDTDFLKLASEQAEVTGFVSMF